jgi:hypothetical protein
MKTDTGWNAKIIVKRKLAGTNRVSQKVTKKTKIGQGVAQNAELLNYSRQNAKNL